MKKQERKGGIIKMGKVNTTNYSFDESGNVMDYYYQIIEMLKHIDIQEMPRIYDYLKEMYFSKESEG